MHRVVVLALNGVMPFELSVPHKIFGNARGIDDEPLYEVTICTMDGEPVTTSAGFAIAPRHDADALAAADTVVVPPSVALPAMDRDELSMVVMPAFARATPGTRMLSICLGAYVLAAAGLLDGRTATTHWSNTEHFQQMFPHVTVDPKVLFVDNGDVITSAGSAAGIDTCLHLVRRDHGTEIANRVARMCVTPPWRDGGQAQYIERPVPDPSMASTTSTRAWVLERLHQPLALAALAAHAQVSVRTLTRRFRDEVGMTPGQWITAQRVHRARHLLETSDLPVDQIAEQTGFGAPSSLRQHLRTAIGVSPMTYRRNYRSANPG